MHYEGGPLPPRPDQVSIARYWEASNRQFASDLERSYKKSLVGGEVRNMEHYSGVLAARVAVLAHFETPELPDNYFLDNARESGIGLAGLARSICAETQQTKVRESSLPWGVVRFGRLGLVGTNYRWLTGQLYPKSSDTRQVHRDFTEGYNSETTRWFLNIDGPSDGKRLIEEAPKTIKGIRIGGLEDGRFVTEHGAILALDETGLPASSTVLDDLSRWKGLRAPNKDDITDLLTVIARRVCYGLEFDCEEEELRELAANIEPEQISAGGWLQELIEERISTKWERSGRLVVQLARLMIAETGAVQGENSRLFLQKATSEERAAVNSVKETIRDAAQTKVQTSYLPWKLPIRFTGFSSVRPKYKGSLSRLRPKIWHSSDAKQSYRGGCLEEARTTLRRIWCPEQVHDLLNRAPRKIKTIPLGYLNEEPRQFATAQGMVFTLPNTRQGHKLPVPLTSDTIRSRQESVRPPANGEAEEVKEIIKQNIADQVRPSIKASSKRTRVGLARRRFKKPTRTR